MQHAPRKPAELQAVVGYTFRDLSLLELALAHKSWVNEGGIGDHNERLEFLGDAILGAVISIHISHTYPGYDEGQLSKLRAAVVSQPVLSDSVRELGLGDFLRLGPGERAMGGSTRPSNLASCFEAIIAGVYLDGGFSVAFDLVIGLLLSRIERLAEDAIKMDYKTALQEYWQTCAGEPPRYDTLRAFGPPHARLFEVAVQLGDGQLGHGLGRSKKEAEQRAARMALQHVEQG